MTQWERTSIEHGGKSPKLLNKTFYKFIFSFVAVVAGVLLFILVLGASSGVQ